MTKEPPTLVTLMENPVRETSHADDCTLPWNGEVAVAADMPAASRGTVLTVGVEVPQSMDTSAKTVVPAEGAST